MAQGPASPSPVERDNPHLPPPLVVDPDAPLVRDFVLRHLMQGTIRVIPGGPGRLLLLRTGDSPVNVDWPRREGG